MLVLQIDSFLLNNKWDLFDNKNIAKIKIGFVALITFSWILKQSLILV